MGKPAARMGDMTAHGGTIVAGFPMVLIGGMPAARVADMHVCPMVTPAPAPVPHVGGPVLPPGSPTVFIGGMPAARMGDMATCTGPPDIIVAGCPTVLIGEGPGSGGGGGGGAVAAARASAHSALIGESSEAEGPHWIEYQFVDSAGNPVTEVPYEYTCVDGHIEKGKLTKDGVVKRGGLPDAGNCTVRLFSVYNAKWSKESARVGDVVKLSADVEGYEDGTKAVLRIWEQDIKGVDDFITEIETTVNGGKVEAEWEYEYHEEEEEEITEEERERGYSSPEYYFIVHIGEDKARSGLLEYKDWIEIELKDKDDNPIANEEYILYLQNGEVRKGKLDSNGYRKEEKVPPGKYSIYFPNKYIFPLKK
jgi:uncharacterized Zn-binding protein involved in type VI secretion